MAMRTWLAPVGLFLLQTAPVGMVQDDDGRVRLAFGAGLGSYEERRLSCDGSVLARNKVNFHTVGGEAEVQVAPDVRLNVHAGTMSSTPDAGEQLAVPYHGAFGGVMVTSDGSHVGLGVGIATMPRGQYSYQDPGRRTLPMFQLRVGPAQRFHVNLATGGSSAPGLPPTLGRVGVEWGSLEPRHVTFGMDFAAEEFPVESGSGSLHARFSFPLTSTLGLGVVGSMQSHGGPGVGLFGTAILGRAPRH